MFYCTSPASKLSEKFFRFLSFAVFLLLSGCIGHLKINAPSAGGSPPAKDPVTVPFPEELNSVSFTTFTNTPLALSFTYSDGLSPEEVEIETPATGAIVGTGINLSYVPQNGFYGTASLRVRHKSGAQVSEWVTMDVTVSRKRIYLRSAGDVFGTSGIDSLGVVDTAQESVDLALSLGASAAQPLMIDVGAGTFGPIVLNTNFGEGVEWIGLGVSQSMVGNVDASGADGVDGYGHDGGIAIAGVPGLPGKSLELRGVGVTFGTVDLSGGLSGDPSFFDDSNCVSGNGGSLLMRGSLKAGHVNLKGGPALYSAELL